MNLKQLEAFLQVAELQSFTKAARKLYLSQPAVSFQIRALEEDLGVSLFRRSDRRVELTEAGRLLYPEAREMVRHYHRIRERLDGLRGLQTGQLEVGASTIPGEYLVPLLLGAFHRRHPGVEVRLRIGGSGEVGRWVRERVVDLGIVGVALREGDLECRVWLPDELVVIVPPDHPWAGAGEVPPEALLEQPFVLREPESGTRQTLEAKLRALGVDPEDLRVVMEVGSTRAVVTAVRAGLGIGVVSRWAARELLALGKLGEVGVAGLDPVRHLYVVRRRAGDAGFAAAAFAEFVLDREVCRACLLEDARRPGGGDQTGTGEEE
ncbi:MAG: LysR family transcriptional regulator [Firmicutes bacterium]|nr:LysR family transcriptional regulator [Bacillota bacterium]